MILAIIIMVILLVFGILRNRARKTEENEIKQFWEREDHANSTRKQDISQLDYIVIPLDKLPMEESNDRDITSYQNTIKSLSEQKILNLTGISNTDLKLQYGAGNLEILSLCDQCYTSLVRTLSNWGEKLIELGDTAAAQTVLEYGIEIGTDVSQNYKLLATIYKDACPERIEELIDKASNLNSLTKTSIINALQAL